MNDQPRCRYIASDQPRAITVRHHDACDDEHCRGCLPCPMDHCRICGIEHSSGACPGCLAEVRNDLAEIMRLCDGLPEEVEVRGVNGEAMNLLGPVANVEARQHWSASVLAGRILPVDCDARDLEDVKAWLEVADHERHPLLVLGTWSMTYRDAFEHDEPVSRVTVAAEAGYLDRNLTEMGAWDLVPFEDFARDLRRCVSHLEAVLHDGEQVDRTRVTCTNDQCQRRPQLERSYGRSVRDDRWRCPSCHRVYEPGEYRDAHARQLVHKGAEKYLPLRDAVSTLVAQGRPERTIRKWLAPKDDDPEAVVGGFCEVATHRVWVWWPDLWTLHLETKTRIRTNAA